ncbi:MAG: metallophosphoesterase [Gemmatimonadota bacterium]|nr:metallophosphoesterase [Gemmatimonadota bacterium]
MRILYVTDLHGRVDAYEKVLERAAGAQVKAIVNGGDLFPLGPDLFAVQREFVTGYLPGHLERCAGFGLDFLSTLGNMDLCGLDDEFKRVMHAAPNAHILLEREATLEGYTFIGSPMTTDGPFSLKDRCLRDTACSAGPAQSGKALISDRYGIHQVEDWPAMRSLRPPLSEHLAGLPEPEERSRVIHVLHQPPSGLGLGMTWKTK